MSNRDNKQMEERMGCAETLENEQHDRIRAQEEEIKALRNEVRRLKQEARQGMESDAIEDNQAGFTCETPVSDKSTARLSRESIERYSRQLLLKDGFGVEGQNKLLQSSVLVIGAGGIGSSVLLYLASSGVRTITVVDFDVVERSNLHRQVIHRDTNVGMNKALSACRAMKELNPSVQCSPITAALTHDNALGLVSRHDCVVDASDNPLTRYLVNDACVLAGKALVSGSAIGTEGQMTVYNLDGGPCYRCLYPKPNTTEGCKSCSDFGVLGPVPGLVGILLSVEVLKVLTGVGSTMHDRLLMYDSLQCSFMNIKKPPKSPKCYVCAKHPTISSMKDSLSLCQSARGPSGTVESSTNHSSLSVQPSLSEQLNLSCKEYADIRERGEPHVLLDVRVEQQFDMCSLEGSVNIPLANLSAELTRVEELSNGVNPVYCLCRRGIFSSEATRILNDAMGTHPKICSAKNIRGGLESWRNEVDTSFPKY